MTRYVTAVGSHFVRSDRLTFFGYLHCDADPRQDYHRALQAYISGPSVNWKWRIGLPRQSWLRTVEADLWPMNLGLANVKRRAQDRLSWWKLAAMTTSSQTCFWRENDSYRRPLTHCYELESFLTPFLVFFFSSLVNLEYLQIVIFTFLVEIYPFRCQSC